jgi:hypothetical protein
MKHSVEIYEENKWKKNQLNVDENLTGTLKYKPV